MSQEFWVSIKEKMPESPSFYYTQNAVYPKYLTMPQWSEAPRILCYDGKNFVDGERIYTVRYWAKIPELPPEQLNQCLDG